MAGYIIAIIILGLGLAASVCWALKVSRKLKNCQEKISENEKTTWMLEQENRQLGERLKSESEKTASLEQIKEQFIKGNKESLLEASKILISDHKKESETSRKESEERIKNATEKLTGQFAEIFRNIHSLNQKVESVDMIRRSLLTPGGAGSMAELILENIFKGSNLEDGRDYLLQYVIKDNEKIGRPDAIVFLPDDDVLIIDSKSSSIFLELETEAADEKDLLQRLKATMGKHLKSLESRDYREGIKSSLEKTHGRQINNIVTVMFLPTDPAWDKVNKADPLFMENAFRKEIFPCGPSGLKNILINSRFSIMRERQSRFNDEIIAKIRTMISSLGDLYESVRKLGSGLESATKNYNDFIQRFNGKFLDKAREIERDGLDLPAKFPTTNLEFLGAKTKVIEGEAEEVVVRLPAVSEQ